MKKLCLFVLAGAFYVVSIAQVNLQSGSATFGLPMFSWKDDKSRLNFDVALNYNSGSGLRVDDLASNVGQGWNMIAGGVISRMQIGEPDDQKPYNGNGTTGYEDITKYPAGYLYNSISPLNGCPSALTKYPLFESKNQIYKQHNTVAADRELDRFSFQINGRSGMFILGKNNGDKALTLEHSKIKIWFIRNEGMATNQVNGGTRTTISAFYIQDENGLIYKFDKVELTKSLKTNYCDKNLIQEFNQPQFKSGEVYNESNFDNNTIVNPFVINCWYLTEIKDPLTLRVITINYEILNRNIFARGPSSITYYGEKSYAIISNSRSKTETPFITSINYPDGHLVTFNYGAARIDLNGDKVLASVDITYQGRNLSKYELNTSYFVLNRITTPNNDFEKSAARLCLLSVKKYGVDLKGDEPPYIFDYHLGGSDPSAASGDNSGAVDIVPPPFFHIKDIWGFYNGNNSKTYSSSASIPIYTPLQQLSLDQVLGLCFRKSGTENVVLNAKDGYAKNGLLKRIIYPTGGSISYSYEQTEGILNTVSTKMAGVHVSSTSVSDGGYSNDCSTNPILTNYSYKEDNGQSSLWGIETPVNKDAISSLYEPEFRQYKFPWSCKYKFKYPGLLSREQATSLTGGQKFLIAFAEVADIVGNIMTVVDIVNVALGATGVGAIVAVVVDIIAIIYSVFTTCFGNQKKDEPTTLSFNANRNSANPLPMQYRQVIVQEGGGGNGSTVLEFTSPQQYSIWAISNPNYTMLQRYASYAYGLPLKTTVKNNLGEIIKQTENFYSFPFTNNNTYSASPKYGNGIELPGDPSCNCIVKKSISQRITNWNNPDKFNNPLSFIKDTWSDPTLRADIYGITFGHAQLDTTVESVKKSGVNQYLRQTTKYLYNANNYQVNEIISTESDAARETHKLIKYSSNFNTGILNSLKQANIVSEPVSSATYIFNKINLTYDLLEEKVTEFATVANGGIMPYRTLEQRFKVPLRQSSVYAVTTALYQGPGSASNPANYVESQSLTYDTEGNVIGLKDEGNHVVTNVYGYNNKYVIATVVNAVPVVDKVAYTSFEEVNFNGWSISGTYSTPATSSVTGAKSLLLGVAGYTTTTLNLAGLTAGKTYTLSYWSNAGAMTVPNSTLLKSSTTINGYTYYEYSYTPPPATTLTITSSTIKNIDELRLYPQLSRMRSVTYDPLIGKTSECDENNRLTYYEYDELGRLKFVKDDYKNTLKMYEYNYAKLAANCNTAFSNTKVSTVFYKNNCGANQVPQPYVFDVAAGAFTSTVSQDVVNQLVENYINANGQNTANANGTCIPVYSNTEQTGNFQKDNCSVGYTGTNVTYTVLEGKYTSTVSLQDANDKAQDEIYANGQVFANSSSNSNCTISTMADWTSTGVSYCVVGTNGLYNGQVMVQFKDENANSTTYNQIRWEATDASVSNACTGVAKVNINYNNPTTTTPRVTFTNVADDLNYFDNNLSSSSSGLAGTIPAGTYNLSIIPVGFTGVYNFTYQIGSASPVNVVGSSVINIPVNANISIVIISKLFYNTLQSQNFTKNDCPTGNYSTVAYYIPVGLYTSTISQANADALAMDDIAANGQAFANINGICSPVTLGISGNTNFSYGYPSGNGIITAPPGYIVTVSIYANGSTVNGYTLSVSIPGVTITGSTSVTNANSSFTFVMPPAGTVNWSASFSAANSAGGGTISVY